MRPVCVEPKRGDYSHSAKPTLIFALIHSAQTHHVRGLGTTSAWRGKLSAKRESGARVVRLVCSHRRPGSEPTAHD
jgi:hypothetical protein